MNNDSPIIVPGVPEVDATTPPLDPNAFETVDPTASFETVDPTAVVNEQPVLETAPVEVVSSTPVEDSAPVLTQTNNAEPVVEANPTATSEPSKTRYNPVTGEEMNVDDLRGVPNVTANIASDEVVVEEEPLKTVEVEYKPTSKGNTIMLIIFFIALIAFVIFLPDLQVLIAKYKEGPVKVEEIKTGTLICTLESSTVNLDREYTREFAFSDKKLQSAKFTTITRGDASLDEEALDELNAQCEQVKANVDGMNGINVSCNYEEGKLTEKESFDYSTYSAEEIGPAYTEAGGNLIEFKYEEDIDNVMVNMRQSGFTCNKEK